MKKLIIIAALTSLTVLANAQAIRTYSFTPTSNTTIEFGSSQSWAPGDTLSASTIINMKKYVYATGNLGSSVVVNGFGSNPSLTDSSSTASIFFNSQIQLQFFGFTDATTAYSPTFGDPAGVNLTVAMTYGYTLNPNTGSIGGSITNSGLSAVILSPGDYAGFNATLAITRAVTPAVNNPAALYFAQGNVKFSVL